MLHIIAEKFTGNRNGGWFGVNSELKEFSKRAGTTLWDCSDSSPQKIDGQNLKRGVPDLLVRLSSEAFALTLRWCLTTSDAKEVILIVEMVARMGDSPTFLRSQRTLIDAIGELTDLTMIDLIAGDAKIALLDEIERHSYTALTQSEALPLEWWQSFLGNYARQIGLDIVQINSISYRNTAEENQREYEKEREKLQNALKHQEILASYHDSQEELKRKSAAKIREIENNHQFSEEQQREKLKLMQLESQYNEEKLRHDILLAQSEFERKRLELESAIAELQNRPAEKLKLDEEQKRAEERLARYQAESLERLQAIEKTQQSVVTAIDTGLITLGDKLGDKLESLINQLLGKFAEVGRKQNSLMTSEQIRCTIQKMRCEVREVPMKLRQSVSRDLGANTVDTLKIGETLAFELICPKTGYATVLNLGTSGRFWLLAPNAYINIEQAKVTASQKYNIPGELLPQEALHRYGLDFIEQGPVGWEELIVLITPKPIITHVDLYRAEPKSPFVQLDNGRMEELFEQLDNFSAKEIAIGAIGFVVTDKRGF